MALPPETTTLLQEDHDFFELTTWVTLFQEAQRLGKRLYVWSFDCPPEFGGQAQERYEVMSVQPDIEEPEKVLLAWVDSSGQALALDFREGFTFVLDNYKFNQPEIH